MNKVYIKSIDALRVISILGVILIHTSTRVLEVTHYNLTHYLFTLFLNQIARFAVPLFFIISGFVLEINYDFHLNYFSYLKKRFSKIFIPYVFWSLIYYFLVYTNDTDNLGKVLLIGGASYQLYFIPTLCIFYLIFPILHKVQRWILSVPILSMLTIFSLYIMWQDYFVKQFTLVDPIRVFLLGYIYFVMGIFIAKYKERIINFIDNFKYFLITTGGYLIYYIYNEAWHRYFLTYDIKAFYSQWRPDIFFYTLIVFCLLFYFFEKTQKQLLLISKLSKLSYLVFFVHVFVLEIIWKYFAKYFYINIGFDLIFFVITAVSSFSIAALIHKIKFLHKLTG